MLSWLIIGGIVLLCTVCVTDMILKSHREHRARYPVAPATAKAKPKKLLVVDESAIQAKLERNL